MITAILEPSLMIGLCVLILVFGARRVQINLLILLASLAKYFCIGGYILFVVWQCLSYGFGSSYENLSLGDFLLRIFVWAPLGILFEYLVCMGYIQLILNIAVNKRFRDGLVIEDSEDKQRVYTMIHRWRYLHRAMNFFRRASLSEVLTRLSSH